KSILSALTAQAEDLRDRVAILEPVAKKDELVSRKDLVSGGGKRPGDSKFAALYFPYIVVGPDLVDKVTPANGDPTEEAVTPVGHVAGVYARVDKARGVHKAPANEGIRRALSVATVLTDSDQDPLNKDGVNVLRLFSGNVVVWGA